MGPPFGDWGKPAPYYFGWNCTYLLKSMLSDQEMFIKKLKNKTINSAFVYYYQPLDPMYKCFVVLILGASSGKASSIQADMLKKIAVILKAHNFSTMIFAADGDTGYNRYVHQTTVKWDRHSRPILDFNDILFSNDVLHLIKRGRYRLLSHNITLINKKDKKLISMKYNKNLICLILFLMIHCFTKCKTVYLLSCLRLAIFYFLNVTQAMLLVPIFFPLHCL